MDLKPITASEFKDNMLRPKSALANIDFEFFFKPSIEEYKKFSVAPYFWLIPNQETMTLVAASENISSLTPYTKEEWVKKDSLFWLDNVHPDHQGFLSAAISMCVKFEEAHNPKNADTLKLNIYCKMLDANRKYRWVLIQFPKKYINAEGKICSTLILTTCLAHLKINLKCMMTIVDCANNKFEFFTALNKLEGLTQINIAAISKREHEVLNLMAKGLNSPQIAEKLFLSYHTVEKHKQNLRQKTSTKTSAQLINYVWANNLI